MITDFQKRIYNSYQQAVGKGSNQPFRYRKNFAKFEENDQYPFLLKLEAFFSQHSHVNIDVFFNAPYKLHDDESIRHDLKFYTTQRAISMYSIYSKKLDQMDPDSDHIYESTVQAWKWVLDFCKENKLKLEEYLSHTTGIQNSFILHFHDRKINIYTLLEFDNIADVMRKQDASVLEFMGCHALLNIHEYRGRYLASKRLKNTGKKFRKFVKSQLQS